MEFSFSFQNPLVQLLLAGALGFFLGIRREIETPVGNGHEAHDGTFMGMRTMALVMVMGTVSTFFPKVSFLPVFLFGFFAIIVAIAYANGAFVLKKLGLTTELSALLAFWAGVLIGYDQPLLAIFLVIFLGLLKEFRDDLHRFSHTLSTGETRAALQLLVLSAAVLPFLPRHAIDPWGVFVPFHIWLLVIFISGLGFVGYFLSKYYGERAGIPLTGFLGAIVSSTAVTASLAARAKKVINVEPLIVGLLIAFAVMPLRVAVEIFVFGGIVLHFKIFLSMVVMAITGGILAFLSSRTRLLQIPEKIFDGKTPEMTSPLELASAAKFALVFSLVLFALFFGEKYFGQTGAYTAASFSGLVDVDAVTLSSLEAVKLGHTTQGVAQNSILIAVIVNTLIKIVYVAVLGARKLLRPVAIGSLIITGAGLLTFWLI